MLRSAKFRLPQTRGLIKHMHTEVNELLNTIEKIESRVNLYWNFYTVVILATGGWLFSSKTIFSQSECIALSIGISMFFLANFSVMRAATKRVVALEFELNEVSSTNSFKTVELKTELSDCSMPGRLAASYVLHIIVDVIVIFAIWSKLA